MLSKLLASREQWIEELNKAGSIRPSKHIGNLEKWKIACDSLEGNFEELMLEFSYLEEKFGAFAFISFKEAFEKLSFALDSLEEKIEKWKSQSLEEKFETNLNLFYDINACLQYGMDSLERYISFLPSTKAKIAWKEDVDTLRKKIKAYAMLFKVEIFLALRGKKYK